MKTAVMVLGSFLAFRSGHTIARVAMEGGDPMGDPNVARVEAGASGTCFGTWAPDGWSVLVTQRTGALSSVLMHDQTFSRPAIHLLERGPLIADFVAMEWGP